MNPLDIAGLGLGWLWHASWQASVLALLVLGVQWGFRARLTPQWRHALWWLVLVRLVLPVAPESPSSLFNLARMGRVRSQPAPFAIKQTVPPPPVNQAFNEPRSLADLNSTTPGAVKADPWHPPALASPIQAPSSSMAAHQSLNPSGDEWIRRYIVWVWLLGVAFYGGRLVLGSYWLARQLRHRAPVENPAVLAVLAEGLRVLGMRRSLTLIATPAVESPALFGWVRTRLLVPNRMLETFSTDEWRYVLMHELAHLRRRDVMVNGLMVILQALHWFNPLIWFAFSRMRADRELACDALVLSFTREDEVKSYGQTIIKLLEGFSAPVRVPGLVGVLEDKRQINRRITMIAQFKKNQQWPVMAIPLMVGLCAIGMTDAQSDSKSPAAKPIPGQSRKESSRNTASTPAKPETEVGIAALVEEGKLLDVRQKEVMDRVVIEKVPKFENATLGEVVAFLNEHAPKHDPDKKGIHFVISGPQSHPSPPQALDWNGLPPLHGIEDLAKDVAIRTTTPQQNVRLGDLLEVIAKSAYSLVSTNFLGIQYAFDGYAVRISLITPELYTRTFRVDPNAFYQRLEKRYAANPGPFVNLGDSGAGANDRSGSGSSPLTGTSNYLERQTLMTRFFHEVAGIQFAPTSNSFAQQGGYGVDSVAASQRSFYFKDRAGVLFVRARKQELEKIDRAIQGLCISPPQVKIEARIVELSEAAAQALELDKMLDDASKKLGSNIVSGPNPIHEYFPNWPLLEGTNFLVVHSTRPYIKGLVSNLQFRNLVHAMEQQNGVDVLIPPRIVTQTRWPAQFLSSRSLEVIVPEKKGSINQVIFPNEGEWSLRRSGIMVGPDLNVIPEVLPDGYTICLNVLFTDIEFLGYGLPNDAEVRLLPKIQVHHIEARANVRDGQTLIIGDQRDRHVPVLSDIPLLGRVFQRRTDSEKRLVIFVTPRIVDPAGNVVHPDEALRSDINAIPPQPKQP